MSLPDCFPAQDRLIEKLILNGWSTHTPTGYDTCPICDKVQPSAGSGPFDNPAAHRSNCPLMQASATMTTVTAKFICESSLKDSHKTVTYSFSAAVHGDDNKSWSKYTPSGKLTMSVTNPEAQMFEPGEYYFLTFSKAGP